MKSSHAGSTKKSVCIRIFFSAFFFFLLFSEASFSQCSGRRFPYPEIEATPAPNAADYFTAALGKIATEDLTVTLMLMVDSLGSPCTQLAATDPFSDIQFGTLKNIADHMPAWKPAMENGRYVNSNVQLSIIFTSSKATLHILKPAFGPGAEKTFMQATVTMRTGEIISCQAEVTPLYGNTVSIKSFETAPVKAIPVSEIQSLVTSYSHFEHLIYTEAGHQKDAFLWMKKHGRIDLFAMDEPRSGGEIMQDAMAGKFSETTYLKYFLRKDGVVSIPGPGNFADVIRPLIADAPKLMKKLDKGEYSYTDIEEIVKKYNNM